MNWDHFLIGLYLLAVVALWIVAFVRLSQFGKAGVRHFLLMLLLMLIIAAILFVVLIVPQIGCYGWFCGLYEGLIFLISSGLMLLVFPLIMLTISSFILRKRLKQKQ